MVVKPVEYFIITCNGCGTDFEDEFSAWSTAEGAKDAAYSEDWREGPEGQDWCPNCQVCDGPHVPDSFGDCARCGEELEETDSEDMTNL